jgi:hypothetical protein
VLPVTTIRYLTATEWGMTWARPPVAEKLLDPEVYVHHVGGGAWMDTNAVTTFRNLNSYAQTGKGYSALDYDVLVHYDRNRDILTIGEGRGKWMSAATLDRNEQGEAVCLCGNYTLRQPLPIELEGAALGIVYGIENGWIARDARILGHKDNPAHPNATGCPGDHLYAQLPVVRERVAKILNPTPTDPVTPPPSLEDDEMLALIRCENDEAVWLTNGVFKTWMRDQEAVNGMVWTLAVAGKPHDIAVVAYQHMPSFGVLAEGQVYEGRDIWGRKV